MITATALVCLAVIAVSAVVLGASLDTLAEGPYVRRRRATMTGTLALTVIVLSFTLLMVEVTR